MTVIPLPPRRGEYPPGEILRCIAFGHHWTEVQWGRERITLHCTRCGGDGALAVTSVDGRLVALEEPLPFTDFTAPAQWPSDDVTVDVAVNVLFTDQTL